MEDSAGRKRFEWNSIWSGGSDASSDWGDSRGDSTRGVGERGILFYV